jgi:hypothetical protein
MVNSIPKSLSTFSRAIQRKSGNFSGYDGVSQCL